MPPRKLTKHSAPKAKMATEDLGKLEWERSKISQQDINMLKKLGISGKQDALRFPKEESYPAPPMQYRVSFVDHLIRGLSTPIHDFLRGLLFMYVPRIWLSDPCLLVLDSVCSSFNYFRDDVRSKPWRLEFRDFFD
ncbi:hypothetical protein QYE76_053493 [Lolium multiflorum]|uniref:Uncharacterized protein n=1 Tax=Lolium multiflorum TaxID=4521 RepID=A0AAD8WK50_LOLMU|nr:hypothetical protein QYE76_053493 [Lolium multiflorum]